MKKQTTLTKNYLEKRPMRKENLRWSVSDEGMVTLEVDNKGAMNRIAQVLFKKPKVSYIHLEKTGSFLWPLLDGEKDILTLGDLVDEKFGDEAKPLYERLCKYFQILDSYGFITWKES